MEQVFSITALIIDDEPMSRKHLKSNLDKMSARVKVLQVCENGTEGIAAIKQLQPDLIFLDVEMPDMSGFDMLRQLANPQLEVIFTTSFDQYAIRAIKFAALDYLLKPIQPHLLQEAVDTAIEKIKSKKNKSAVPQPATPAAPVKTLDSLAIPTLEGLLFVEVGEIIWCESEGRYTNVCFAEKKPIMASRNLAEFEELLTPAGFIRVHKSHLINLKHVKRYIRGEGGQVIMTNGKALDVGRAFKQKLLEKIEQFR